MIEARVSVLERRLRAIKRAAVVLDNGYRRCLFCEAWTHAGQRIRHESRCPIGGKS